MRCINLDWLEVYVLEDINVPQDIDFFLRQGFYLENRGYGTPTYEQMFTLFSFDEHFPFIEVRRKPKSDGVLPMNAAHIRFVNRYCYMDNAGDIMREFLRRYHYQFVSISRVDVCLDFEYFDKGDDPEKFIKRYIGHKYAKINQSKATAHFDDTWELRDFNSLSWGSDKSDIRTKLYNKTRELYDENLQAFKKPYILQAWFYAGLIDDPVRVIKHREDGTEYRPTIWRLEFSIKGNVKGWFTIHRDGDAKKKHSLRNTLEQYLTRDRLLPIFDILQQHYFHFKKFTTGKSKYECADKVLFTFGTEETFYRVEKPASDNKPDALILRLRRYLSQFQLQRPSAGVYKEVAVLIDYLDQLNGQRFTSNVYDATLWKILQRVIALKTSGDKRDIAAIIDELKAMKEQKLLL